MRKTLLSLALAAGSLTAVACSAQTQPQPPRGGPGGMMMRADANGDGTITRQEALAAAGERFDRMDANHDGKLDRTELANMAEMRHLKRGEMRRGDTPPPPPAGQ